MKTSNQQQNNEVVSKDSLVSEQYELIENETLTSCNQTDLTISGALLKENIFKEVVFENCTFFGSKLENCFFVGCRFKNCKFQFSTIKECNFFSSSFENCFWEITPLKECYFESCQLDLFTLSVINRNENTVEKCFCNKLVGLSFGSDFAA